MNLKASAVLTRRHMYAQLMVGVAYFGHALLLELLLPKLRASAPARVVWMSGALESQAAIRWDDLGCAQPLQPVVGSPFPYGKAHFRPVSCV